jgi:hypothetical protein
MAYQTNGGQGGSDLLIVFVFPLAIKHKEKSQSLNLNTFSEHFMVLKITLTELSYRVRTLLEICTYKIPNRCYRR